MAVEATMERGCSTEFKNQHRNSYSGRIELSLFGDEFYRQKSGVFMSA